MAPEKGKKGVFSCTAEEIFVVARFLLWNVSLEALARNDEFEICGHVSAEQLLDLAVHAPAHNAFFLNCSYSNCLSQACPGKLIV